MIGTRPAIRALRVLRERSEASEASVKAAVVQAMDGGLDAALAARAAHRAADAASERVLGRPGAVAPACRRGCSYCCHVHVEAAPAEIDAVAAHLVAVRTPVEIDGLLAALPRGVGLTPDERWAKRIPCALLGQDGGCSIHPVRPLRCRAFHSCDAGRCRSAFSGDSDDEPVRNDALSRAYDAAEAGLRAALEDKGITAAPELFELGLLRRLGAR